MKRSDILKHFKFDHLPVKLKEISLPCCNLALTMEDQLPNCDEKAMGLRKLLEAKDCFVRASLETKEDKENA